MRAARCWRVGVWLAIIMLGWALGCSGTLFLFAQEEELTETATAPAPPETEATKPAEEVTKPPEEVSPPAYPMEAGVIGDSVNIRRDAGSGYRAITKVYSGSKLTVVGARGDWYEVKLPPMTNAWITSKYVEKKEDGTGEVTGSGVHIRAGNSTDYDILGQLDKGDKVKILEEVEGWCKIEPQIATGFVIGKYLDFSGKPPVTAAEAAAPGAAEAAAPGEVSAEEANLRKKFEEAEAAYSAELEKPVDQWNFEALMPVYQEVAEKSTSPILRATSRRRVQSIGAAATAKATFGERKKAEEEFLKRIKELEEKHAQEVAEIQKQVTPFRYLTQGEIQPLAIDFAAPATHKLLKKGKIEYLVYSTKYDLDELVGKKVGILGEVAGREAGVSIIHITRLDVMEEGK